jgi:hypothetical protein
MSFRLSIISVYSLTLFLHNSPSLVGASNKFACVVDGVYMCVSLLPIDRYHSHRSKPMMNYGSWEFICSLHFEYGLLRGRRRWRWTDAVSITPRHTTIAKKPTRFPQQLYITCRISTISQVAASLAGMSSKNPSNCKACFHACFMSCHPVHLRFLALVERFIRMCLSHRFLLPCGDLGVARPSGVS